jgi:hypothetical protein
LYESFELVEGTGVGDMPDHMPEDMGVGAAVGASVLDMMEL